MKQYIVESISTFYEIHVVEAKNEEEAKEIAKQADYNLSEWLGQTVVNVRESTIYELNRFRQRDPHFFNGYSTIDKEGFLVYHHPTGEVMSTMTKVKVRN